MLGNVSHMTVVELEEWGVGLTTGIGWEDALHSALMPITPQASMGSLADGKWRRGLGGLEAGEGGCWGDSWDRRRITGRRRGWGRLGVGCWESLHGRGINTLPGR